MLYSAAIASHALHHPIALVSTYAIVCAQRHKQKWLGAVERGEKEQGELYSANILLEGTVAELDQELQRAKVCQTNAKRCVICSVCVCTYMRGY